MYLLKKHQNDIVHRKYYFRFCLDFSSKKIILFRSWTEATLEVAVRWLLRQCGRIETESRRKCIELVCTFIPLLPGREYFCLSETSFFMHVILK